MPRSKPRTAADPDTEPRGAREAIAWWKAKFLEAMRRGETITRPAGRVVQIIAESQAVAEVERGNHDSRS